MSTKLGSLAKTTRPSLAGILPRERLFSLLDRSLKTPVTWVTGPPGSGKTTLVTEDLLSIYRGAFLGEDMDQPWYFGARDRLRNKFVRAVGEIGKFWERSGKWERAVACYERSLEADPVAEALYRRLMICCQEFGRRAQALEVYNRCRKTLSAALEVEPSPETKAVYEQLLHPRQ